MKRIHLIEFTEQSWFPDLFRQFQIEYLQFAASLGSGHVNLVPIFKRALDVPESLRGMRTMFEGFHHFKPDHARKILADAVEKRTAIGLFDAA